MLLKRLDLVGLKIGLHSGDDLRSGQHAVGFDERPCAVDPMRFQRIEPGAFPGPAAGEEPHPAVPLHSLVMGAKPAAHWLATVPGGVIPDPHEEALALSGSALGQPAEQCRGDVADGAPLDTAQEDLVGVGAPQAITAECVGSGLPFRHHFLQQVQGSFGRPGGPGGVRQPAPPGLIETAQDPIGMRGCHAHQPVAALFF
jgi:hypothetical protein